MIILEVLLPLVAASAGVIPTASIVPTPQPQACAPTTADARRVVEAYSGSAVYEKLRVETGVPSTGPEQVRALTEDKDAAACAQMRGALEDRARAVGRTANGVRLEFYQAGDFFYAVRTLPPSTCKPGPHHACIDLRWRGLHVFDRELKRLSSIRF